MSRHRGFDFDSLPEGSKDVYELQLKAPDLTRLTGVVRMTCGDTVSPDAISDAIAARLDGDSLSIPVLAVKGAGQGKTLVATAGVHGDEYEGMEAIFRTFEALDPSNLSGTFVAVPVVTLPAFWQATRANPVDGLNMARIFPGSPSGSMSERLAALMLERVFRHADLYIDLHSSGRNNAMMTLVGYAALGRQAETARAAAECFGAPMIWEHPKVSPGRTLTETLKLEIPSLYTEARGGGRAHPDDVDCYTRGLANLLAFLEMAQLPAAGLEADYEPLRLCGDGDVDVSMKSRSSGLFFSGARVGMRVREGDLLGMIRDLDGTPLEEVRSPQDGVLVMIRTNPRIFAGEVLLVINA